MLHRVFLAAGLVAALGALFTGTAILRPFEIDAGLGPDPDFPAASPEQAGLDRGAIESLEAQARATDTSALIIVRDGRTVVERYFGHARKRVVAQSVTKSVISLLIGRLLFDGRIASLDQPAYHWFPEWAADPAKSRITLRMLMNHTSGLVEGPGFWDVPDLLAEARALPLISLPGTEFHYSNAGVELLSAVIAQAAGMPADAYARARLFEPLGITRWRWDRDPAGNVATPGGLRIEPRGLLRIGSLMLEEGRWNGQPLLPAAWIHTVTEPSQEINKDYGLLWWLSGPGEGHSYAAVGWQGQYIVVSPRQHLVAIRMRTPHDPADADEDRRLGWREFPRAVEGLFSGGTVRAD